MRKFGLLLVLHLCCWSASAKEGMDFVWKELAAAQTKVEVLEVLDEEDFYADSDSVFLKEGKSKKIAVVLAAQKDGSLDFVKVADLPKERTWEHLYRTYQTYQQAMQGYYGDPKEESKTFEGELPEYDGAKMEALRKGNCRYHASFAVRPGWVARLSITYDALRGSCVSIVYRSEGGRSDLNGKVMEFMKIPLDGPVGEFAKKMRTKGFVLTEISNGTAVMEGRFAGHDRCQVFILESELSKNVRSVMVSFQHAKEWHAMMSVYTDLRDMLVEKYGIPTNEKGRYDLEQSPESPSAELRNIENGTSEYSVVFRRAEGAIVLSVTPALNVMLGYTDMRKWEEKKKEAIDDL